MRVEVLNKPDDVIVMSSKLVLEKGFVIIISGLYGGKVHVMKDSMLLHYGKCRRQRLLELDPNYRLKVSISLPLLLNFAHF